MELSSLSAISAIDGRYRKQLQHLDDYFSEYALMKYRVVVEVEYLALLAKRKFFTLSPKAKSGLASMKTDFTIEDAESIKAFEAVTNHDVKAVEYFIKQKLEAWGETGIL